MTVAANLALADWVRSVLHTGGYVALGLLTVLENLFPPIPSEIVLPLAGFYVGREVLLFVPALLVATAGSLAGALILYAAGRYGGRPMLDKWGRFVRIGADDLERGEAFFARHGGKVVFLGRLVPGVRSVVSLPAGAAQMPLGRFIVLTTLGSGLWNAALIGAGLALGANWEQVGEVVGPVGRIAVLLAVLGLAGALGVTWKRRRDARAG